MNSFDLLTQKFYPGDDLYIIQTHFFAKSKSFNCKNIFRLMTNSSDLHIRFYFKMTEKGCYELNHNSK